MKLVAGLIAVVVTVLSSARADADCAIQRWLGTPTGARVPAKGSIYLYSEMLEAKTPAGPIKAFTQLSDTVARIDYDTKADELELHSGAYDESTVLQIDRHWKPPADAPRVIQIWHHAEQWTCSYADSVMLQIDQPTAAFRVRWTVPGKAMQEWIVPARTAAGNVNVLELGKIDCGGTTIDPAELAQGGHLALVAIRYDGSEIAVKGVPHELSFADLPTAEEGLSRAIEYPAGTEPIAPLVVAKQTEPDPDFSFHIFTIVLAIAGALLVVRFRHRALKEIV